MAILTSLRSRHAAPNLLISGGVLLLEWVTFLSEITKIKPTGIFGDNFFALNSFFGPQLTLPLAMLTAWLVVRCVATAVAAIRNRPLKGA